MFETNDPMQIPRVPMYINILKSIWFILYFGGWTSLNPSDLGHHRGGPRGYPGAVTTKASRLAWWRPAIENHPDMFGVELSVGLHSMIFLCIWSLIDLLLSHTYIYIYIYIYSVILDRLYCSMFVGAGFLLPNQSFDTNFTDGPMSNGPMHCIAG